MHDPLDLSHQYTGQRVTSLHGNRSQNQRTAALKGFKQGNYQIMVATDIAARGLDIENISHVINFDMPDTADAYIHRIGRTARAESDGIAITLISEQEQSKFARIEKLLEKPVTKSTVPEEFGDTPEYDPSKYRGRPQGGRPPRKGSGGKYKGKRTGDKSGGNNYKGRY